MNKIILSSLFCFVAAFANAQVEVPEAPEKVVAHCAIEVPPTFAPGLEDGKIMEIQVTNVKEFSIVIFDRWGKKVLESAVAIPYDSEPEDSEALKTRLVETGWDATYKDRNLKPGSFFFTIEAICFDETPLKQNGNVSLVRPKKK
jgi:hypothetical protein